MRALPPLMVAPNGANRTKADHPALPVTLDEIVATARACRDAGADGLHLHLRDAEQRHLLDAGRYREALAELRRAVPGMALQVTTEANGIYAAPHQRQVALEAGADMVSAALREILRDTPTEEAAAFYRTCAGRGIAMQHILYDAVEIDLLHRTLPEDLFADPGLQLLFVLGRYTPGQTSTPDTLAPFLDGLKRHGIAPDWAVCAFGQGETACLRAAHEAGGKLRVGFENSLVNEDGQIARDNAERVMRLRAALKLPEPA
ncbi:3-keto-5-aminohexanoate cleavage protein [Actibacterium sp. MT2.3-13A]|uniref:3-keto-5-aminohexanoate cleavage protein n=1 Tax=Actibacterium sp. MT2.3-13A TaxID=2828332 RepID=UPI001BA8F6E6|nr:3-keto-5-aminohexanoate cleavage protein [Actibacterium sp. MT2.3-13A]